jgi:hypothetical protein
MNGQKNFGQLAHKLRLLLRREHQVTVAFVSGGKGSEDPASHPEISRPHVRAFLCSFEAQRKSAKIRRYHREYLRFIVLLSEVLTQRKCRIIF